MPGSSCDLSSLDPLCNDSEEILRQLVENPFDVDSFFTEFSGADVKVSISFRCYTESEKSFTGRVNHNFNFGVLFCL